jgi:hypothetical protein
VIVFSLDSSCLTSTSNDAISPIEDVVGLRGVTIAFVQGTGRDIESLKMRRNSRSDTKPGYAGEVVPTHCVQPCRPLAVFGTSGPFLELLRSTGETGG